jgi:hypothetical protein
VGISVGVGDTVGSGVLVSSAVVSIASVGSMVSFSGVFMLIMLYTSTPRQAGTAAPEVVGLCVEIGT